ncbi:cellulose synthase complex periplasmic endoglucanase BcsZ [Bordetella sp. 2513F-2]
MADDRQTFRRLVRWTEANLAQGDLGAHLPAWLWGRAPDGQWRVLDANSASDADLWIAYALLEAGRIWGVHGYAGLGTRLAQRIARDEVQDIPGLGPMLLPGKTGFVDTRAQRWRLNPSYVPLQILARLSALAGPWRAMADGTLRMLEEAAPHGYAPDWVAWQAGQGWQPDPQHGSLGDYDAIRVYLWAGMLADDAPQKARLLAHYAPMARATAERGTPPEAADAATGRLQGSGPAGFSAALLPLLAGQPGHAAQRRRLQEAPPAADAYYGQSLALFGQGWDDGRYRFDREGRLVPAASACAN